MAFEAKKFNEIIESMRERSTVLTDFEVGSVTRTTFESVAFEIGVLYEKMHLVYLSAYIDTAEGSDLDKVVDILGIKRNLPDFADGIVTFMRDIGNNDILIPLGTLIATADTPENPKKVYKTILERTLRRDETFIDIKVQAVERGEAQVTAAETIINMPRPIPGIKDVRNKELIRHRGKRRETDKLLRERAKNALIASGKATINSVEDGVFSLPGITDVRVKEYFHFARGSVKIEFSTAGGEAILPRETVIKATQVLGTDLVEKRFKIKNEIRWTSDSPQEKEGVLIEAETEGKEWEILNPQDFTWAFDTSSFNTDFSILDVGVITLVQYGVIDVIVAADDFADREAAIRGAVDEWRAAGIYPRIREVEKVVLDGVFSIGINSALNLTAEDELLYEQMVQAMIMKHLDGLRIGETFLFSRLIREVLSADENFNDLSDFVLKTSTGEESLQYTIGDKKIELDEEARFEPRYICVAAREKALYLDVEARVSAIANNAAYNTAVENLRYVLANEYGPPTQISPNDAVITGAINPTGFTVVMNTLKIRAEAWSERLTEVRDDSGLLQHIDVSFVERPVLRTLFLYRYFLDISGVLKLTFPSFLLDSDKETIKDKIFVAITEYLDRLGPEENVLLEEIIRIAKGFRMVLDAEILESDFAVQYNSQTPQENRVADFEIDVSEYEKTRPEFLFITDGNDTIDADVVLQSIGLSTAVTNSTAINNMKIAVANAFNAIVFTPGENIDLINDIKNILAPVAPSANIDTLEIEVLSQDDFEQVRSLNDDVTEFHIRSIEHPRIIAITSNAVNIYPTI